MKSLMPTSRRDYGFTVVELTIVIIVMSILALLAIVTYDKIKLEARDYKRAADITMMRSALEKHYEEHGEYPAGAHFTLAFAIFPDNEISSSSTIADIQQFLPNIPNETGDPFYKRSDGTYRFSNGSIDARNRDAYYYLGSWSASSSMVLNGTINFYNKDGDSFPCNYKITVQPNETSSFIIGHYSESKEHFVFYSGEHGKQWTWPREPENQPYCVPQN